jgi:hypothetical protein
VEPFFHTSPVVLTDEIFFQYTPNLPYIGTSDQRQAAYTAAEQGFIEFAFSPIYPTQISGTYPWGNSPERLLLRMGNVISIDAVTAISLGGCNCTLSRDDGCGIILNARYGIVSLRQTEGAFYSNCGHAGAPYQAEVVYTAGFPTGVIANDPALHMALSMVAEIYLNEIVDPSANEGGPGAPGVTEYSSLGYSETRGKIVPNAWGQTARTQSAALMARQYKAPKRALRMG